MQDYDHIFIVTNDLSADRRVARIINTLAECNRRILLIGRVLDGHSAVMKVNADIKRVRCTINKGPLFYLEFNIRVILLILSRFRSKSLTCNDVDTVLIGIVLHRFRKVQLILDYHEWFEEVPELEGKSIKKKIWHCLSKVALSYSTKRYTVNKPIARAMSESYGYTFEVVRNIPENEIDIKSIDLIEDEPLKLVYLGVLNKGRGLIPLIDSIGGDPNYHLTIIGLGDIKTQIENFISDKGGFHNIDLTGHLNESEFTFILKDCHVGMNLLSNKSKSYYYSSANKVFDYINRGLIVMTMDFPFYRMISEHCDSIWLLKDINKIEILEKLGEIRSSYDSTQIKRNKERLLNQYNWSTEQQTIKRVYDC